MLDPQQWMAKRIEAGTTFTPSTPINSQELFAGRRDQIVQIIDVINQLGQHAILYGERGVGKSSLANVLASYLGIQKVLSTRVNCEAGDTFDSVWRKVIEQIGLTQQQPGAGFVPSSKVNVIHATQLLGDVATPHSVRNCLISLSNQFVPVFAIDEFDRLDEKARRAFADLIKTLSDHSVRATILLVGVADSVDQLIAEHQSIQRALAQVRMPRMDNREVETLLDNGVAKLGMKLHTDARRRIVRLTQGLPHYAHLLALHAVRAAIDNNTLEVSTDMVEIALERALKTAQQSVLNAYETAVRSARKDNLFGKVLLACAMAETNELGEFAAQDIRDHLSQITGKRYEIPQFAQHLKEFTEAKRGPVLKKSGVPRLYRYRFIDSLLQPYVIMQGVKDRMIKLSDL